MDALPNYEINLDRYDHFKNRGLTIPKDIFNLMADGIISPSETLLLSIIDACVDARGEGCWMSNRKLAGYLRLSPIRAQKMVSHLKKLGLVKQTGWKKVNHLKYRILETSYSRVTPVKNDWGPRSEMTGEDIKTNTIKEYPRSTVLGGAGEKQVFFPDKVKHPNRFDLSCADQLREVLKKKGRVQKWNKSKWADQFRLLRTKDGWSYQQVQSLLDWFEVSGFKFDKPSIFNATHFRNQRTWLNDNRNKDVTSIEISPQAESIIADLEILTWPKNSGQQLPAFVEQQLRFFKDFFNKVKDSDSTRIKRILEGDNAISMTRMWMRSVNKQVVNWKEWTGKLEPFIWTGDVFDKRFTRFMVSQTGCNDWSKLMESL